MKKMISVNGLQGGGGDGKTRTWVVQKSTSFCAPLFCILSRIFAALRSHFFSPKNRLRIFLFENIYRIRFSQKVFIRSCAVIRSLFLRAPQMSVYKVKWSFFECRKWVFIKSDNFQNYPQAGVYKVKCWFCVRPYNHHPL